MKNPETQRQCHQNLNLQLPHIKLLYFHQRNPTQNNCIKTPTFATLIWHLTHTMLISTGNYPPVTCGFLQQICVLKMQVLTC